MALVRAQSFLFPHNKTWALFHHLLVWLAAERVYPKVKLHMRCLVILIADRRVAPIYASFVERLGVKISYLKSISHWVRRVCLPRVRGQQGYISCIMSFTSKLLPPLSYGAYAKIRQALVGFGRVWKCYDLVAVYGKENPLFLPPLYLSLIF